MPEPILMPEYEEILATVATVWQAIESLSWYDQLTVYNLLTDKLLQPKSDKVHPSANG